MLGTVWQTCQPVLGGSASVLLVDLPASCWWICRYYLIGRLVGVRGGGVAPARNSRAAAGSGGYRAGVLTAYRRLFAVPGARAFTAAGFVMRLPLAMVGLGCVLLITRTGGS
jgi:hypothetical protein